MLSIAPDGKIALSIKRTEPRPPRPQRADTGRTWQPRTQSQPQGEMSFEDMMSQFKSRSEEKISDLRRVTEARRGGGYSRRAFPAYNERNLRSKRRGLFSCAAF